MRHVAYAGAWKRLEPMWDLIIRAKRASAMLPVLETTLAAFGTRSSRKAASVRGEADSVAEPAAGQLIQVGAIERAPTEKAPAT